MEPRGHARNWKPRRRFGAVAALVSTVSVLGVPASSGSALPDLAGHNTLTGSTSGALRVHLPAPTAPPSVYGRDVQVTGDGRIAGFWLTQDVPARDGATVIGWRIRPTGTWETGEALSPNTTLPAGDYVLYLLADGGPVTVTFDLPALTGTATLVPERSSSWRVDDLTDHSTPTSAGEVFAAGDTHSIGDRGGVLVPFLWFQADQPIVFDYGVCTYAGAPAQDPSVAFGPYCPDTANPASHGFNSGGPGFDVPTPLVPDFPLWVRGTIAWPLKSGSYSIGGWIAASHVPTDHGALGVWFTFD